MMQEEPCRLLRLSRDALCLVATFSEDREHFLVLRLLCQKWKAIANLPQSFAPIRGPITCDKELSLLPTRVRGDTFTYVANIIFNKNKARRFRGVTQLQIVQCTNIENLVTEIAATIEQVQAFPTQSLLSRLQTSPKLHTLILDDMPEWPQDGKFRWPEQITKLEIHNCCVDKLDKSLATLSERSPNLTDLTIHMRERFYHGGYEAGGLFPKLERVKWLGNHPPLCMRQWASVQELEVSLEPLDPLSSKRHFLKAAVPPPNVRHVRIHGAQIDIRAFLNDNKQIVSLSLNDVSLVQNKVPVPLEPRMEPLEITVYSDMLSVYTQVVLGTLIQNNKDIKLHCL